MDTQLNALERLKMGTTCMFSMMGGNGTRTDDVVFTQIAARELERIGLRTRIGLGPARPPWPRRFAYWRDGVKSERMVEFDQVIDNCDRLLSDHAKNSGGIVDYGVALSRIGNRNEHDPVWSPEREQWIHKQAEAIAHLKKKHGVTFWTHMYGNAVEYAHDEKLGLLGPDTDTLPLHRDLRARDRHHARHRHARGTSPARRTHLHLSRTLPGAGADRRRRQRRARLGFAVDAQLRHVPRHESGDRPAAHPFQGRARAAAGESARDGDDRRLQRRSVWTRSWARWKIGKKADLITVDLFQPHLYPIDMLIYRLVYNATGSDVVDVAVSGRLVMEGRKILTIDEGQVLERVQSIYDRFVVRAELEPFRKNAARMWGASRE